MYVLITPKNFIIIYRSLSIEVRNGYGLLKKNFFIFLVSNVHSLVAHYRQTAIKCLEKACFVQDKCRMCSDLEIKFHDV